MSKAITITVKDEYVGSIEAIQKACSDNDISFSALSTKAIIEYFVNGGMGKHLVRETRKQLKKDLETIK